jgi:hypothetical protein
MGFPDPTNPGTRRWIMRRTIAVSLLFAFLSVPAYAIESTYVISAPGVL